MQLTPLNYTCPLYQIQTKFRDEERPKSGVLRTREFLMKDAYSFNPDKASLDRSYEDMYQAYCRIFGRCGLPYVVVEAESGPIGGDASHEFMVVTDAGEDWLVRAEDGSYAANIERAKIKREEKRFAPNGSLLVFEKCIEIGHVFKLGTKYSVPMRANFVDEGGNTNPILMGCYGIGLNRVMAATIESHHDTKGICWPHRIAPFKVLIVMVDNNAEVARTADYLHRDFENAGIDTLLDDRDCRFGIKLNDADLIGIPLRIIVGTQELSTSSVNCKQRNREQAEIVSLDAVLGWIVRLLN